MLQQAITFKSVSFKINQTDILKDISGTFFKGHITTLIGPSGAGKTSLLKMCNGLISPSTGQVKINHENIESIEPTILRRQIGIALQSAPILRASVYENLALPSQLQQQELPKEEAISFLQAVGLDKELLLRGAIDLSGGQKQKLSIARTLVNQSEVLLLDEITSALDPNSVKEIEDLVMQLNKKYGVTIIWITHNIEQAKRMGHFTWMLKDGQLVEADKTEALFQSSNTVVQAFIQRGDET